MITIPTSELTGTIGDVLGFVDDDKNNYYRGIVIQWTGGELRALAYDVLSGGAATWTPGEGSESEQPDEDSVDSPFDPDWGSEDHAWRVWISLDDAKEIVKTFKLPAKEALTPVTVETTVSGSRLIVARAKTDKRSAHTMTIDTDAERCSVTPDPAEVALVAIEGIGSASNGFGVAAWRLAPFTAARQWDVADFRFGRPGEPVAVRMSSRFTGFIFRAGDGDKAHAIATSARTRAADFLRTGSGVQSGKTVEADLESAYGGDPESADLLSDPNA